MYLGFTSTPSLEMVIRFNDRSVASRLQRERETGRTEGESRGSEDADARSEIRELSRRHAVIASRQASSAGPLSATPDHTHALSLISLRSLDEVTEARTLSATPVCDAVAQNKMHHLVHYTAGSLSLSLSLSLFLSLSLRARKHTGAAGMSCCRVMSY